MLECDLRMSSRTIFLSILLVEKIVDKTSRWKKNWFGSFAPTDSFTHLQGVPGSQIDSTHQHFCLDDE